MNGPEDSSTAVSQAAKTLERMTDLTPSPDEANYVLSYKGLRKAIGIIGIALPIGLLIGKPLVDGGGMLALTTTPGCATTSLGSCARWLCSFSPTSTHVVTTSLAL